MALVTAKLNAPLATRAELQKMVDAQQSAAVSVSTTPDFQLAIDQLNASFDAVMAKLDRIEMLVDKLPCKVPR